MKRLPKIAFAVAVILTISGMGQPLYAQRVRTQPTQIPRTLPAPAPPAACCSITAIDTSTGVVTAKVNATGNIFQFKVNDATLLNSLKVGQDVYANFTANQVSLDGNTACCPILAPPPPAPAPGTAPPPPPPSKPSSSGSGQGGKPGQQKPRTQQTPSNKNTDNPTPNPKQNNPSEPTTESAIRGATAAPCCSISAIDTSTGVVTAKENATGKIFQFKVADSALLNSLKVGQGIYANFRTMEVSLNGSTACCPIISTGPSPAPPAATAPAPNPTPAPQRVSPPSLATPAATPALVPPAAAQPASASTPSGLPGSKRTSPLSPVTAPPATGGPGTRAGNSIPALLPAHSLPPGTGFQKCCTVTYIGGTVGPGGGPSRVAKVNSQGWSFPWMELPKYNSQNWPKDFQVGSPIWVNFGTAQVSTDGVTVFGRIYATPVKYQQTVHLDVLPIGVIYVPPGDPNASMASSVNSKQSFSQTNISSTTTTTVVIASGSPGFGDPQLLSFTLSTAADSASPTVSDSLTSSLSTMAGSAAQGPGGYPGENDLIWFYVNPGFDVTYIGAWIYDEGQRVAEANPAQITSVVPHPKVLWNACHATIQELQTYDGGDTLQADARCLNDIPKPTPPASSGNAAKAYRPMTLTPAQKLIQMDPMIVGNRGPMPDPYEVSSNPSRFQPISRKPGEDPGTQYWVTYCATDSPLTFGDTNTQMQTGSTTTTTKFSGGVNLILDPVAIAGQVLKLAAGVDLPIPGSAVAMGDGWDVTKIVTNSVASGTQWNVTGNFGSGTYGTPGYPSCDQSPAFWTSLYYDWANHTVLFFRTGPGTGSAVSGSLTPGAHIVLTPVGGGRPMVVYADSIGQFHFKLPPGNYTYRAADSAGHALTTTPLSVAVRPNEPFQLPHP